jgi:hypothetical protein
MDRLRWVGLAGLGCGIAAALLALQSGGWGVVHGAAASRSRATSAESLGLNRDATLAELSDGAEGAEAGSGAAALDTEAASASLLADTEAAGPQRAEFSAASDGSEVHGPVEPRTRPGFGGDAFEFRRRRLLGEDGTINGSFLDRYPDGSLALEGEYEDGERSGEWTSWRPDGTSALEGNYEDGRREGRWKAYHPNGQLLGEGDFNGGNREGVWTLYYSSGQIKEHGLYNNNLRTGPWQFYDPFGQLEARSGYYRNGRKLGGG